MKAHVAFRSEAGPVSVSHRQRGFTIVSTMISFTLASLVITGGWMAVRDLQAQLHVQQVDRQMDQYAQSAIQELTNRISWAWAAVPIQGGSRNTRWNFLIKDEANELGLWQPDWPREMNGYTQVRYHPTRGILIGGVPPKWAEDNYIRNYVWTGRSPRSGARNMMDRRDRMTMESLIIDYHGRSNWASGADEWSLGEPAAVQIELTLQYRYRANGLGLYSEEYARERTYRTSVYCRNWWSDLNGDVRRAVSGVVKSTAGS